MRDKNGGRVSAPVQQSQAFRQQKLVAFLKTLTLNLHGNDYDVGSNKRFLPGERCDL
jgi:hypothetical protein